MNSPHPRNPYLNVSIIGVTGFKHMKVCTGTPMKNLLPVWLNGYTIGVAYIHSDTKKDSNTCKSRYLVVRDEKMVPNPRARPASMKMTRGSRRAHHVRWAVQFGSMTT